MVPEMTFYRSLNIGSNWLACKNGKIGAKVDNL